MILQRRSVLPSFGLSLSLHWLKPGLGTRWAERDIGLSWPEKYPATLPRSSDSHIISCRLWLSFPYRPPRKKRVNSAAFYSSTNLSSAKMPSAHAVCGLAACFPLSAQETTGSRSRRRAAEGSHNAPWTHQGACVQARPSHSTAVMVGKR